MNNNDLEIDMSLIRKYLLKNIVTEKYMKGRYPYGLRLNKNKNEEYIFIEGLFFPIEITTNDFHINVNELYLITIKDNLDYCIKLSVEEFGKVLMEKIYMLEFKSKYTEVIYLMRMIDVIKNIEIDKENCNE